MIQKKVCMLGSYAVGKTSLVRQYVDKIFSENYTTSIGVKVDKKNTQVGNTEVSLLLWDIYGEDSRQTVLPAYLRGMAGYLLVVDPTRPNTYKSALSLHELVKKTLGDKPFVLVLNKCDLKDNWQTPPQELAEAVAKLRDKAVAEVQTSAKTDLGVDDMFDTIAIATLPDAGDKH